MNVLLIHLQKFILQKFIFENGLGLRRRCREYWSPSVSERSVHQVYYCLPSLEPIHSNDLRQFRDKYPKQFCSYLNENTAPHRRSFDLSKREDVHAK